jgi:hypothetical protein
MKHMKQFIDDSFQASNTVSINMMPTMEFLSERCKAHEERVDMENLVPYIDKRGRKRGAWENPTGMVCDCGGPMIEASIAEEDFDEMTEGQIADYQAGFWKIYLCKECYEVTWAQAA